MTEEDFDRLYTMDCDLYSAIRGNRVEIPSPVSVILATIHGEREGANWHWFVRLDDGKHAYITGGCDYTGWDCCSNCEAFVEDTLEAALRQIPEAFICELRDKVAKHAGTEVSR